MAAREEAPVAAALVPATDAAAAADVGAGSYDEPREPLGQSGSIPEAYAALELSAAMKDAGMVHSPDVFGTRVIMSRVLPLQPLVVALMRGAKAPLLALHVAQKERKLKFSTSLQLVARLADPAPSPSAGGAGGAAPAPRSPASGRVPSGEADIVFVLESAPTHSQLVTLRERAFGSWGEAVAKHGDLLMLPLPQQPPDALHAVNASPPLPPPGSSADVTPPGQVIPERSAGGKVPSPQREPGKENDSTYFLCEVGADANYVLPKLVQIEAGARTLAGGVRAGMAGNSSAAATAAAAAAALPAEQVADVVSLACIAIPLDHLTDAGVIEKVVSFIRENLPYVAHMYDTRRLLWLHLPSEQRNVNAVVAGMVFSNLDMGNDIKVLKNDMKGLKNDMKGLKNDMNDLKNDMNDLNNDMNDLKNDMNDLKNDMNGLTAKVESLMDLKAKVDTMGAALARIENLLGGATATPPAPRPSGEGPA